MDSASSQMDASEDNDEVNVCRWSECAAMFSSSHELGQHLGDVHVGKKQSKYTCEWQECLRHGEPLPNRFALVAHLRRHTGERPFKCAECSRSFSRSDALSKHVKVQHNGNTASITKHELSSNKSSAAAAASGGSPNRLSAKLRRKLEYLESERSMLTLDLQSVRTRIKRIRAEKLLILDLLLNY